MKAAKIRKALAKINREGGQLELVEIRPWHWQVRGGKRCVNYSPTKGTVWAPPLFRGAVRAEGPEQLIRLALQEIQRVGREIATQHASGPRCPLCSKHVLITQEFAFRDGRMAHTDCIFFEAQRAKGA